MTTALVSLSGLIEQHQAATTAFLNRDLAPWKNVCSHRDDVTIVGGWGGYERGWCQQVEKRYEWAAARIKSGHVEFENIALVATSEMAYRVDIERARICLAGSKEEVPMALRVTTIYRLEDGAWKMVHRHADPLVAVHSAESVIER